MWLGELLCRSINPPEKSYRHVHFPVDSSRDGMYVLVIKRWKATMTQILFEIAYRTGGTSNFKWQPVIGAFTRDECAAKRAEIERMGYKTVAHKAGWIETIGLPDGWEA